MKLILITNQDLASVPRPLLLIAFPALLYSGAVAPPPTADEGALRGAERPSGLPGGAPRGLEPGGSEVGSPVRIRRETVSMGTRLAVTVDAPSRAGGLRGAERAVRAVARLERLLSTWEPGTALSQVNDAPVGEVRRPPGDLARLLAEAEGWSRRTHRVFEPAVGALIDAWDLRGTGRRPTGEALADALGATGPNGLRIDSGSGAVTRLHEDAWLDAGAFGKGAALAAAAEELRAAGIRSASLDLGGQILTVGAPARDREGWMVGVAHPLHRDRVVATLRLRSVSAATSGASERGVDIDSGRVGHVLDPRTGLPVPAWGSVTVVSADPLEADVLSTALFVLGPEAALAWARDRSDLGVLVLEPRLDGLRTRWTSAMERWLVDRPPPSPKGPSRWSPGRSRPPAVSSTRPEKGFKP